MSFFLEKKSTQSTPYVLINEEKHYMKLEGMCFHENATDFFEDIVKWLAEYLDSDFDTFTFDCKMKYFNSSTTKLLFDMLQLVNESAIKNKKAIVNWHVNKGDDLLTELYEDIEEDYQNLTINLITS